MTKSRITHRVDGDTLVIGGTKGRKVITVYLPVSSTDETISSVEQSMLNLLENCNHVFVLS